MRLPWQLFGAPTVSNSLKPVTFRDSNDVHHFVLLKHRADLNRLLKQALRKVHFVRNRSAVDLDLHQMSLLLREASFANLGVGENADDGAVFADTLEFAGDRFATVFGVLLGVPGKSLFLGSVPILVEAAFDFVREMGSPDSSKGTEAAGGLNITHNTDDHHRWSLDDSDSFYHFSLVHL